MILPRILHPTRLSPPKQQPKTMIGSTSRLVGLTVLALAGSAFGSSIKVSPASKACQLLQKSFPKLVSFPSTPSILTSPIF